MIRILVLGFIVLFLSGCKEVPEKEKEKVFKWAVVNDGKIESEVLKIAKEKNIYKNEFSMDKDQLQKERRRLSKQLSKIEAQHKSECLTSTGNKQSPNRNSNIMSNQYAGSITIIDSASARINHRDKYDQKCVDRLEEDELAVDLRTKKERVDELLKEFTEFDRKVRKFSQDHTLELIENYSASKFEVVVGSSGNSLVFNSEGVALDITDAVMASIEPDSLKFVQ